MPYPIPHPDAAGVWMEPIRLKRAGANFAELLGKAYFARLADGEKSARAAQGCEPDLAALADLALAGADALLRRHEQTAAAARLRHGAAANGCAPSPQGSPEPAPLADLVADLHRPRRDRGEEAD